jgi:hypothetical protein
MTQRTARCACGKLTARCTGDPTRISICHCGACKQRTGSAFSYNATFAEDQVEIAGASAAFTRISEDGFWATHHFCPECGCGVFYRIERRPGLVSIPVGAFADRDFPEPAFSVYDELRHGWIAIDTADPSS